MQTSGTTTSQDYSEHFEIISLKAKLWYYILCSTMIKHHSLHMRSMHEKLQTEI
jgi:hypothetical protein